MESQKGISLISLVITIIVIIILAAIVIFNGFGTTDSAQFAKFAQEYSGYGEDVQQRYMDAKIKSSLEGTSKTDKVIYSEIGNGIEVSIATVLMNKRLIGGDLDGTVCYKLQDGRTFYQDDGGSYVTENGEIFTYPGYRYKVNGEERRYVNATKYYLSDGSEVIEPVIDYGAVVVEGGTVALGNTVKYIPDEGHYVLDSAPSGKNPGNYKTGADKTFLETDDEYGWLTEWFTVNMISYQPVVWKVFKIEDGKIYITPSSGSNALDNNNFPLAGENGVNNIANVLNYLNEELFSNNSLGLKARQITLKDVGIPENINIPEDNHEGSGRNLSLDVDYDSTALPWFFNENDSGSTGMFPIAIDAANGEHAMFYIYKFFNQVKIRSRLIPNGVDCSRNPEAAFIQPVIVLDGRVKLTADGADTWSISKAN